MSPLAGASATANIGRLLARAEDRIIPLRLFAEPGRVRRAANATYRLTKLALFDDPQENWLRVANHEVFGHGARLRELFDGPVQYSVPPPPPYGRGGGATFFELNRTPTVEEILAVTVGGMEANRMMARLLTQDALTSGSWDYRDARRYRYAEYDTINYILRTHNVEEEGHDVGDFIRIYNDVANEFGERPLSARILKRRVLVGFANPMIAYSFYSTFVSYVWQGNRQMRVPMLQIGDTRYLPMARFQLTPFGTEWVIDNALIRSDRFIDASVRFGDTIGARTWGFGAQVTRVAAWQRWTLDGEGHLWHQPDWGGEFTVTAKRGLEDVRRLARLSVLVQGGYKTDGFLAGERLHQGGIFRVGLTLLP